MLALDSLKRDLARYGTMIEDADAIGAQRILTRMIDTVQEIHPDLDHKGALAYLDRFAQLETNESTE
jgi:hypothetical protein